MKKQPVWILFGLTAILLAGCHKDDNHRDNFMSDAGNVRLRTNIGIDMKTVVGFTLVPEGAAAPTAPYQKASSGDCMLSTQNQGTPGGACTKLYALTATGVVVPVALVDVIINPNQGGGWQNSVPTTIYNVGKFVFFVFDGNLQTDAGSCGMVVLQKSDGALYCSVDSVMRCAQTNGCNGMPADKIVQASADGALVNALGWHQELLQLDFANPASAVSKTLFDPTDGFLSFFIANSNGDVLSTIGPAGSNTLDLRLYKRAGGFVNLPAFTTNMGGQGLCTFPGLGTDSSTFYAVMPYLNNNGGSAGPMQNKIHRIGLAAGAVTTSTYAADATNGLNFNFCNNGVVQASTLDRHFINWQGGSQYGGSSSGNQFTEVYNPAGVPKRHTAPAFASIVNMYGCDNQLILRGRDAAGIDLIARYYPETVSTSVVIKSSDYSITAVAVSDSCEITFGGRRAADNSRILGNIAADSNEVKVYSNNLPGDVKELVRIK